MNFREALRIDRARAVDEVNVLPISIVHQFKTTAPVLPVSRGSVKRRGSNVTRKKTGMFMDGLLDNRGDRTMRVLRRRC